MPRRRGVVAALAVAAVLAGAVAGEEEEEETCAVGGASAACSGGDAGARKYHWPLQKGDANRTGLSPFAVPRDLAKPPSWQWVDPESDVLRATPLIDDELNIYQATISGRILKFSPDGETVWFYRNPSGLVPTVPAIMDGALYSNAISGEVFALDMATGRERWRVKVGNGTASDTACVFAAFGTIVSATKLELQDEQNNAIVALNADGSHRWTYKVQGGFGVYNFQAASPGDGTLIFQDSSGGLYKLSLETGSLIWESGMKERKTWWFTTAAAVVGPNGLVYVVSQYGETQGSGVIHAYQLSTGEPVWKRNLTLPAMQGVAIGKIAGSDGLSVVLGVGENPGFPTFHKFHWYFFYAFPFAFYLMLFASCYFCWGRRRGHGKSRLSTCCCLIPLTFSMWLATNALAFVAHGLSLATGGQPPWLFVNARKPQKLVALDAATGAERWVHHMAPHSRPACAGDEEWLIRRLPARMRGLADEMCLPDSWAQAVIDADGTAFVGHTDGRLWAVRDEDGDGHIGDQELSAYDFGHAFQASQGLAPGLLAVAPCGGGLSVWRT